MEIDLRTRLPLLTLCLLLAAIGLIETQAHLELSGPGWDAHAYWGAWRGPMYAGSVGTPDQYLYSPAFAQLVWPLAKLPWPVFAFFFIAVNAVGLAWLLRPLPLTLGIPLWLAGSQEIFSGNIFIPLAVTAVVGMRLPHMWAFAALTKITPCLGPVWFAVRGEWASLLKAAIATALIIGTSWLAAPGLWADWLSFLAHQAGIADGAVGYAFIPGPLYRIPVAIVVVVIAARTERVWLLPVAMLLATPFIWNGSFTLLGAIPRLRSASDHAIPADPSAGPPAHPPSETSAPTG